MSKFSFIHCADLHLGCQQFNDPRRYDDFFDSFSHIVDYAVANKARYFLISGDLFHHRNINANTLGSAMSLLDKLRSAGIEAIAIEGNHDKAFYVDEGSWMKFLNDRGYIKLLKPVFDDGKILISPYDGEKGCVLESDELRVIGLGYLGATTAQRLEEAAGQIKTAEQINAAGQATAGGQIEITELIKTGSPEKRFTIIMLHAAVDKLIGQDLAGVSRNSFRLFEGVAEYIALGHIHSRQEQSGFIFNPGAPECVHIDEARKGQEKGFYHVTVEDGEMNVKYVESLRRPIMYFDVDISGIRQPGQALDLVLEKIDARLSAEESSKEFSNEPVFQINLYGSVDFSSYAIEEKPIVEAVKQRYGCMAVELVNGVNLLNAAESGAKAGFDRSSLERDVILKMIEEEKPEYKEISRLAADLTLKAKNYSITGVDEDEIISMIDVFLDESGLGNAASEEVTASEN